MVQPRVALTATPATLLNQALHSDGWHSDRRAARRGVTLLELLVVLVLMAIVASLVLPNLRLPDAATVMHDGTPPARSAVDGVVSDARRLAIRRGEPVRLQVARDGVWAAVSVHTGSTIQDGRITGALSWRPDMTIDALGVCTLAPAAVPRAGARAWDALACRWQDERT